MELVQYAVFLCSDAVLGARARVLAVDGARLTLALPLAELRVLERGNKVTLSFAFDDRDDSLLYLPGTVQRCPADDDAATLEVSVDVEDEVATETLERLQRLLGAEPR